MSAYGRCDRVAGKYANVGTCRSGENRPLEAWFDQLRVEQRWPRCDLGEQLLVARNNFALAGVRSFFNTRS